MPMVANSWQAFWTLSKPPFESSNATILAPANACQYSWLDGFLFTRSTAKYRDCSIGWPRAACMAARACTGFGLLLLWIGALFLSASQANDPAPTRGKSCRPMVCAPISASGVPKKSSGGVLGRLVKNAAWWWSEFNQDNSWLWCFWANIAWS